MGDYAGARLYYERALAIFEQVSGLEHPDTATSLNNLGGLLQAMGDYEVARSYYERALAIREKVLGPQHPDTAQSLNNLGVLLQAMGDYEAARPYYERALALAREIGREDVIADAHWGLTRVLEKEGRYTEALPLAKETLRIRERLRDWELDVTRDLVARLRAKVKG